MGAPYKNWLAIGRQIENCSISQLLYDEKSKTYHVERFNDFAHFENEDRLLRKHFGSGFFKKKDKNTIPETDMQENVAQMMEEPMDQDPVQEDADIADTDMNDIGVQETAVDAGNAVDEADIADDDTETSEDLDDTDRNSQAAEEYEETGNIIDCDSLVKIYKTDEVEVMALQGLELTIKKGELMAVIGKSGSGKSTLLNMIGGLERPTAGKLYVDGIFFS